MAAREAVTGGTGASAACDCLRLASYISERLRFVRETQLESLIYLINKGTAI